MAERRNNGDGTIYEYDNRWYAAIQVGVKPDGSPLLKKFSAKTEREVRIKLRKFKQQQGLFVESSNSSKTTVKQYFEHWLYEYKIHQLKEQSFDRLESVVKNHIINEIGVLQFGSVKQSDIQNLINKKQKEGLSYSTIKKIYDALRACYTYDYNKGPYERVCSNIPVYNIVFDRPAIKSKKIVQSFTEEEIKKIKDEIYATHKTGRRKYIYGEAYLLILNTGLRAGEILGLRKSINPSTRKIYIGQTLITTKARNGDGKIDSTQKIKQTKLTKGAKNKSSNRWIYLNDNAVKYVTALKALPRKEGCTALVVNKDGEQVTVQAFIRQFDTILKNAGIIDEKGSKRGVHALRHTFATNMFKSGINVKIISKTLGHSSVKITYDTYIHVIESLEAEAMSAIPNV